MPKNQRVTLPVWATAIHVLILCLCFASLVVPEFRFALRPALGVLLVVEALRMAIVLVRRGAGNIPVHQLSTLAPSTYSGMEMLQVAATIIGSLTFLLVV